ncbi:uncharacterized protein LOC106643748 [Copidosoma floridanum]|uniref:uncharacterized protein LOC106643748 n=1 Tax=Copidosoma floridanum TaxID=29053 RepID=UPI0006C9813C|nr:uncharacterized protein LOC106643748 [Copidosoma floridanum]
MSPKLVIVLALALISSLVAEEITDTLEKVGDESETSSEVPASHEGCDLPAMVSTMETKVHGNDAEPKTSAEHIDDSHGAWTSNEEEEESRENSGSGRSGGGSTGGLLMARIDKLRQVDNREDTFRIIDPRNLPQTQLVDNALRFMAIKSSVDDLAMRIFPNLRMLHRTSEDRM